MLKINQLRTFALATALTVGTACTAQNRLQNAQKEFLVGEFKKADNNPQDYYITQDELNAYMGNNSINVNTYDQNKDGKLNIDEFANVGSQQVIVQQSASQQVSAKNTNINQNVQIPLFAQYMQTTPKVLQQMTPTSKSKPATKRNFQNEGKDIYQTIINTKTINWQSPSKNDIENIILAYRKIDKNNLEYVLNNLKNQKNYSSTPGGLYTLIVHKKNGCTTQDEPSGGAYRHLYNVLSLMLKEKGKENPVGNSKEPFFTSNGAKRLDAMYWVLTNNDNNQKKSGGNRIKPYFVRPFPMAPSH